MVGKPAIRIFIASPSDVRPERLKAEQIIARLDREFAHHFRVEGVLFEREPLVATHHIQDEHNLSPPHTTDIAVVILWTRLGVPLPAEQFRGALSGRPVTGTEWEFEDALAGARANGSPDLLVYRKRARPTAELHDRKALEEQLAQIDLVEDFFTRWFRSSDGGGKAASRSFVSVAEFEEQLYDHLHELLERRTGSLDGAGAVRWHQAPFRGLLPFDHEHSPVFFGRTRARNELRDLLSRQIGRGQAFVLVLGASGSGKSSVVRAGLLADLKLPGMIARVALCRHAVLRPSDSPGDLLAGLAAALLDESALPELADLRYTPERLAELLRHSPDSVVVPIEQGLQEAGKKANLAEIAAGRLVIVIDQFEELFTLEALDRAEIDGFVAALSVLARCGLVWIVATMRSDFYDRLETVPALARLAANEACYRLLPPTDSELGQIIREPAREAGLRFEFDAERGVSLDEVIRQAAARDRGALPLLSFLLDQLWQRRSDHGDLTFAAYDELGHLEGALGRRAEEVFSSETEAVQATLPRLLRALVTVRQDAQTLVAARTAPLDQFAAGSDELRLIAAFLAPEARLLVAEDGDTPSSGARVRVAHEALLTHWERARDWIFERPADLHLEEQIEHEALRWTTAADRHKASLLRPQGLPLGEAEDLAARRADELSANARAFIAASGRRARRRQRVVATAAVLFALLACAASGAGIVARIEQQRAERTLDAAKQAVDVIVINVAHGLRNVAGVRTATIRALLESIQKTVERLASDAPDDAALARLDLAMLDEFTSTYLTAGDLERARSAATAESAMARSLAAAHPDNPEWRRFVSVSLNKMGEIDLRQGNVDGADTAFTDALALMRALVEHDPGNGQWKRDLASSLDGTGDVKIRKGDAAGALAAYDASISIIRTLAAADPADLDLQRETAARLNNLGDTRLLMGDSAAAAADFKQSVEIMQRLSDANPANTQWQRDLFVALTRVGDLQAAKGDDAAAFAQYQKALSVVRQLAANDPGNSQLSWDTAVSLTKTGDGKFRTGDIAGAATDYQEAVATMRRLIKSDPENTAWQRDLSVCLNKIGDLSFARGDNVIALAAYEEGLSIARQLAGKNLQNKSWMRDLSVSLSKIGDLKFSIGDTKGALAVYVEALENIRRLSAADPDNMLWLRDLSVTLNKTGDIELLGGHDTEAIDNFQQSLTIIRRLAQHDPTNVTFQQDLAITLNKFGDAKLRAGDREAARAAYDESIAALRKVTGSDPQNTSVQVNLAVGLYKVASVEDGSERNQALQEALEILDRLQSENKLAGAQADWPALLRKMLASAP